MIDRLRRRLTYANVTATLALFVALCGGSFAIASLGSGEKRVIKRIANKQITKRAPGLSVKGAANADKTRRDRFLPVHPRPDDEPESGSW